MNEEQKKGMLRDSIFLAVVLAITLVLVFIFPEKQEAVAVTAWDYFMDMILILPAVMVLMGLFTVWVSKEMVVKYLGKSSGVKGIALSIFFGSLPTGPLYVAFPLAASLIQKGARISSIIIFLSAWACIKLPQELVELQFLGPEFMLTRLILTVVFISLMGFLIEGIIEWKNGGESNADI